MQALRLRAWDHGLPVLWGKEVSERDELEAADAVRNTFPRRTVAGYQDIHCPHEGCGFYVRMFSDQYGYAPRAGEQAGRLLAEHLETAHTEES